MASPQPLVHNGMAAVVTIKVAIINTGTMMTKPGDIMETGAMAIVDIMIAAMTAIGGAGTAGATIAGAGPNGATIIRSASAVNRQKGGAGDDTAPRFVP